MSTANTLSIIRGDSTAIPITFTDANGDAINLTGCTVFFTVKHDLDDLDAGAIIKKDITSHSQPTLGKTTIVLTATDTNVSAGLYWWDTQIKTQAGEITSTMPQRLTIQQDITIRTS